MNKVDLPLKHVKGQLMHAISLIRLRQKHGIACLHVGID